MTPDPEIRKARERDQGRRIAEQGDAVWGWHGWAGRRRLERRAEDALAWLGSLGADDHLLELGCGTGLWSMQLTRLPVGHIHAVDISEDLLERARARPETRRIEFRCADIERLPYETASMDAVCGLSVLHHLDVPAALGEIARVLKPGRKIWFSEPNMANPQIALQKNIPFLKRLLGDTPDERAFFRRSLTEMLKRAGFCEVSVRPFDFLHPALPESLARPTESLLTGLEGVPGLREIAGSLLVHARRA